MRTTRPLSRLLWLVLLLTAAAAAHAQQNYPSRPIRYIIPYPPGGSTDPMGRMVVVCFIECWG